MAGNKKTSLVNKFHFENGLLRELRAKAAPVNQSLLKAGKAEAKKAAKKRQPKSTLSKLPSKTLRRLIAE